MIDSKMRVGNIYKFKAQKEILLYVGKARGWHQFELIQDQGIVWSELLDSDLHLIESAE